MEDKCEDNHHIPFGILLTLAVASKLKLKTSLTDVPFAGNDAKLLAELGLNVWDQDCNVNDELSSENIMCSLLDDSGIVEEIVLALSIPTTWSSAGK